ncbi:MAG: chromosome segregation protein SMC [Ruminococcaceae bacterium]|nr:chromosome segregation protein SMC [Oscillospiraceae bacterium]
MLLRSIEVQGFKSFADKTVLKFGKGITAVVGPNGSGKSNISDAVRWVLGEQSTKSLRGQSMEDVIFSGTATRRPHGFCEVTLNIDNSDRTLNFDNDSVSITRRFYRSHESEYLINNVSVRLRDVNELFMDTGLGRDGYSMIGQGKIDNIISSKSGERRDIFEEASGISKYRYRKTEAERKLSAAEENLLRLKDIMSELESRVGPLEQQSKKAEKFLALAEEKKTLEIGLWLYTLANSKQALREQENKIAIASMQYKEIDEKLQNFDSENDKNSREFALLTTALEEIRNNIASFNEEIAVLGGEMSVIDRDKEHNNLAIERLIAEREHLKSNDVQAEIEIEEKEKTAALKEAEIKELEEKINEFQNTLNEMLSESEAISKNIEELVRSLNTVSLKNSDLRVAMMTADSTVKELLSRTGSLDETIKEKETELSALDKEFKENEEFLKKTEETVTECANSLVGYEMKYNSRKEKAEIAKEECEKIRLDREAKIRRIQILSELEKNLEGFQNSVKAVMSAADMGTIRGIHGPVSKIITVEKQYSVAIETALGSTIQQIVCDSENDAKRAIEMLKSTGGGRATFLPISSIRSREFKETGFEDMYGYIGLAPDLIKCDEQYKEIIKYLLGNTVVCEDLDSAVKISKKFGYRLKTVSLDGQVVNSGGSLTGGSLIKNAGILSRASDIRRLEGETEKLAQKLKLSEENYNALNAEVAKAEADITAAKATLANANEDKIRVLGELKRIDDMRNAVKRTEEELKNEKTSSAEKIEALKKTSQEAAAQIAVLDGEKDKLQAEIDKATGGRDNISGKREEIGNSITAVRMEILEKSKDVETLKESAKTIRDSIGNRQKRMEEITGEISGIDREKTELDGKLGETKEKINFLKEKIVFSETEIERLTAEREKIEKQGIELRQSEKERTLEREKVGGELARLTERKEVMLKEYDDVIRQLYDEYQLTRTDAENMGITVENPSEAKKKLNEVKSHIRGLGNVNVSAIEEYKEVYERYTFMSAQIEDVEKSRTELNKLIGQLTAQMKELFTLGFDKINQNFAVTFTELFGGGVASLSLSDPDNVLESGIDINVKLPGKNVPSLDGLSGGEKALIALAIYFAIMRVNAPPFCFLDEVDTALDDINVERVADYMKRPDFSTQFICVTHRRGTMEAADMLYGVTMQEKGITKLLELNVSELEKKLMLETDGK